MTALRLVMGIGGLCVCVLATYLAVLLWRWSDESHNRVHTLIEDRLRECSEHLGSVDSGGSSNTGDAGAARRSGPCGAGDSR